MTKILTPSGIIATSVQTIEATSIVADKMVIVKIGAFLDDTIEPREENALLVKEYDFFASDFGNAEIQATQQFLSAITDRGASMSDFQNPTAFEKPKNPEKKKIFVIIKESEKTEAQNDFIFYSFGFSALFENQEKERFFVSGIKMFQHSIEKIKDICIEKGYKYFISGETKIGVSTDEDGDESDVFASDIHSVIWAEGLKTIQVEEEV